MFKERCRMGNGGWYWLTQKSSKGCWDADIGLSVSSWSPRAVDMTNERSLSRYLDIWALMGSGSRLSLSRIGDSESVHSYIPSSITWLRPVFWALGTSTRIFCLALFIIDQYEEQSFPINCQVTGCHSSVNWGLRPIINEKRNFPPPATLSDCHWLLIGDKCPLIGRYLSNYQ